MLTETLLLISKDDCVSRPASLTTVLHARWGEGGVSVYTGMYEMHCLNVIPACRACREARFCCIIQWQERLTYPAL